MRGIMRLTEMLELEAFQSSQVVAGAKGLEREVDWVHIVDHPDPPSWVQPGQFLLTTGYAWPREEAAQRALVRALAQRDLAGVGLAVPQFFEHFPPAACDEANRSNLPLLELPWEVPFARIVEEMLRAILVEQYKVIKRSEEIHRALTCAAVEAGTLQDLALTLRQLIQRTVAFTDREGQVLAFCALEEEESILCQLSSECKQNISALLAQFETLSGTPLSGRHARPLRAPNLTKSMASGWVVSPVWLKGELVGLVWIVEDTSSLSELDLRAVEHSAVVAALHIAHQRELASLEASLGNTFLDSLLKEHFEPTPQAIERAQLFGFGFEEVYRVGILVLDVAVPLSREGFLKREWTAERLRKRLQGLGVPALLSTSLNQIPFLLPQACSIEQLWDGLANPSLSLILSRPHKGAKGLRRGYREVLSLLPHCRPNNFYCYESLLLPRVLMGEADARKAFIEELLGTLRCQRNGDMLAETLLAFARKDFQAAHTAQALCIHPKTLRYRMERAAELGGVDLRNPETRFRLQLAAHLLSLGDKETS